MAIVSKEQFMKSGNKKSVPRTAMVSLEEFKQNGALEMERRQTAFENYKKAVAALQQEQQRRQQEAIARNAGVRADVMQQSYYGYRQADAPQAAQSAAYENYKRALQQQYELDRANALGQRLDPKQLERLTTLVYRDPGQAARQEASENRPVVQNRKWAEERRGQRQEQLSEQEFNRSGAMQEQYGSYDNYLRGVYAGYDEAVARREAGQAKSADELRAERDAVQRQLAEIDARQKAAWTQRGYSGWDPALQQEKRALQERNRTLSDRAYWKEQEEYKAGRQAERQAEQDKYAGWTAEQMQARIDEIDAQQKAAWTQSGYSGWDPALQQEKEELKRQKNRIAPGALQKAANFADDAATAFFEAGTTQARSGFEMARNVAETKLNQGVAWALRDISNSAALHALGGDHYAEELRALADRMATDYDYKDAQALQDDYTRIMNEVLQDHSPVGTWILQQLPSAGAMVNDAMMSALTGGALTPLTVMGIRAGGSAMLDAHNEGATDTQALIIGLENAAVEVFSEKLFGGNPVYDEDVGLVNRAVAKLTKSKTVMKVLDSKAFDFVSEGLEEVIAELLEPTFQSMVLNGSLEGSVTWESVGNSFLGGVFLAALGDIAGLPAGVTQAKQERQAKFYAKILAEQGAKSENADVREAAAAVQEKLDYGRAPDIEDIGRVLSAMDDAEETQAAEKAVDAAKGERSYNQYKAVRQDVEQAQNEFDINSRRKAVYDAEAAGEITREEADARLDALDSEEAINRSEAEHVQAGLSTREAEDIQHANDARSSLRSQQERENEIFERQTEQQSTDTVRKAGAQYGWSAPLTETAAKGYAAYSRNSSGALSAAEYADAIDQVYQYGTVGAGLDAAQEAAHGVQKNVIRAAWEAGRRAARQSGTATEKYSINDTRNLSQKEQFKEYRAGRFKAKDEFAFGAAPESMQKIGLTGEIVMSQTDYKKAKTAKHNVPQRVFNNLNSIMDSAVLSFEKGDEVGVLTSEIDADGKPLLLAFRKNVNLDGETVTRMKSAYGLDTPSAWVQNQIKDGKTLRILDSKKADNFLNSVGYKAERTENYQLGDTVSEIQKNVKGGSEHGKNISDEGQKRNAGARAGEQARRVEQAAGGRSESARRGRERADQAKNLSGAWPQVTNAELLGEGGSENTVRVMPASEITKNADARKAADFFRTANIKSYKLVVGQLEIERDGKIFRADGATLADGTVLVRLDSEEFSAFQLAKHEVYHLVAQRNAELAQRIRKRLVDEGKISRAQIDSYIEAYNAIYGDNTDAYVEEIVADAYAGINRTAYGTNSIRAEVTMEAGQWTKKTGSARAPPENRYSIEKLPDGKQYVKADRQVIFGNDVDSWSEQLEDYINGKIRRGQDVTLIGADGDELILTATSAGKLSSPYTSDGRTMSETAYERKANAAAHIDELAQVSTRGKNNVLDAEGRHGAMASEGWNYRTAFFMDFDGKYYKTTISVSQGADGKMIYNIGKMQERSIPQISGSSDANTGAQRGDASKEEASPKVKGSSAETGNGPRGFASSKDSIRQNSENVNGKFSASLARAGEQGQQEFEDSGVMSQEEMNEYEYSGGHTLDSLPKKAQEHVRKTIRDAAFEMRRNGYQMFGADTKTIETALEGLANEYLQTGNIEAEKISEAFETVWKAGGEQAKAFRETYRQLLAKLRHMEITPSAGEQQRFDDFKAFQKQTRGKLNLVDEGGRTLREVYEEMSAAAPELFPRSASTTQRKAMMLLLGIRRMQTVEEQLKGLEGKNAEVWKQRAATEFEASVRNMQGSFRIAQRYADAQMRTGNAFKAPESVENVQELYKLQREQRRSYERVERQYLLTAHDQRLVNQLLRGDLRPEDVRSNENAEAVLAVYEAKADYDLTTLKITEWNKTVREQRNAEARTALGDVRTYKDKKTGFQYKRETQTRNVRDIAPEANADVITKNYFEPVRKAAADSTRLKKRFRERVNALGLKRRRNRGDKISESAAVQILGEAEDNIRVLERNRAWMEKRDGKTQEEWAQMIANLWAENPSLDKDRIRNAVKEMQSIYDELFEMMNEVRIRNGRAPINYRSGYFPHFQIGTSDGILNLMGAALGVEAGVEVLPDDALGIFKWWLKNRKELRSPDALPTEISGLTKGFKPGIQWFANALERTGGRTVYDAVQGFDRYIEGAADIICFTDSIQSIRALARQVRYLSSSEGMREQMDAIMRNNNLTEEEKEAQVDSLRKDGRYRLSKWVENLDEYANLLANKKSELDRNVESILNRSVHSFLKKWQSRVAANMVSINPGSWLTNFGVIMQAAAQMKPSTVAKAMYQQAANAWVHDGFAEHSDFLTARAGSDRLVSSWVDNASQVLSKPMELIDWYSSNVIVRARFMENIERGMSEELAMQEADQFAANVMADRSKGAMPTMFESRNPLVKVFTQFQLEVNNTFSYLFKDMPQEQKKKGLGALALAWIKFLLFDWMFNEGYEALIGRRPMLDVLDLIEETGGDIFGYSRNNVIWALMNGEPVFEEKDPESGVTAAANLALNVGQELPFVGNLVGGGRLPYTSTFPDARNIKTTLDNEKLTDGQKAAKILGELKNPMAYWVLPFGGGQLKKMIEGGSAVSNGGSYKLNSKGEQELQYPVYTDRPGDKIKAWSTAMVFGKSSLKTAQDWVEDDFKRLSAKETTAYEEITKFEDQRNTFEFIKAAKQLKGKTDKLVFLDSYTGVSERAKAEYYYQAVTEGTEHEEMATMSQQERVEHLRAAVKDAKNEQLKEGIKEDLAAGTISEQKAIQKLTANDLSKSEDDAYWTVQKWMGGKDYKKYGDFLAAVDAGGDVAKAAKTYLDNGVEAETLSKQITDTYKQQYRAASEAERKRLKKLLLDAYAAIGYDRKKKEKDIDEWLKDDE